MIEIGKMPKTLKLTQKSVEKWRQINSFKIAKNTKNIAQRQDKVSQAFSLNSKALSSKIFNNGFFK